MTHNNEFLDTKTEVLMGLSAAIAMNCAPCTAYYLKQAKKAKVVKGEVSEVIAKVMAVAASQNAFKSRWLFKTMKLILMLMNDHSNTALQMVR